MFALVAGGLAVARTVLHEADSGPSSHAPASSPLPQDSPASAAGATPCTELRVLASLENADMLQTLATAYAERPRDVSGHCVTVVVTKQKSGLAAADAASGFADMAAGQRPTMWLPDSAAWLAVARATTANATAVVPASGVSVARSAIVVAMPATLASAIGWRTSVPSWSDVFKAADDPTIWQRRGHPEWGSFKFGKTSPQVASSGLFALVASYGAAASKPTGLTPPDIRAPAVVAKVKAAELATSHYMATPQHFLWHARQADAAGSVAEFLSATIVDEKSVWDYNRGLSSRDGITEELAAPPTQKLVAIYPSDGVYVVDNPAAILNGSWITAAQRAAAADFIRYLGTEQGQALVRAHGYRDIRGHADSSVVRVGALANALHVVPTPAADVLTAVQASFPAVRKRARVLFLLDVSGSMADRIGPNLTKLKAAQHAVADSLAYFTGDDDVGLAAFSNYANGPVTPGLLTPVAPLKKNRHVFETALARLKPVSQTPLFAAVGQFVVQQVHTWKADRINAVVLLSDGRNDSQMAGSLSQLKAQLEPLHHTTPVLVFTLAYGKDADTPTLQAIAKATGAHYYDATDPATVDAVLGDLVTSF
jgi:Ca-activated chloride channel homolog